MLLKTAAGVALAGKFISFYFLYDKRIIWIPALVFHGIFVVSLTCTAMHVASAVSQHNLANIFIERLRRQHRKIIIVDDGLR